MTPKDKSKELVDKMLGKNPTIQDGISIIDTIYAKLCALIAVDEILTGSRLFYIEDYDFWQEVKKELEKL